MAEGSKLYIKCPVLEAIEGLFGGPRNFERWSMTRTTPELAPLSKSLHATPPESVWPLAYDLACNRPHTRRIFSGTGFPEPNLYLPLGHRGLQWRER
ncbi:hypothetical protein AVEN_60524-1 [Araneus ventricosus]|uniref:Uncharacterized protein n=1 Tax=Araneus ventricosus TaxID=182803 RepID=A0A4Y2FQD7_ARAVE|nr:hypothetical protein AVEN_60524-1 [Araneus ventricosus]